LYGGANDDLVELVAFKYPCSGTSVRELRVAIIAFWCKQSQFSGNHLIPMDELASQIV